MYRNDLIKGRQAELEITIEKLCEITGISHETINRIRKGENVSVDTLRKVADALGIPMSDLFQHKEMAA